MTAGTPDPFEHEDAAYVLGALGHEERIAYEEHLRTCDRCSAAVAELAVLPGLLSRLPALPPLTSEAEQPPDTVLPGLLARMRRARARRRGWGVAAGVAAAAVLIGGTAAVTASIGGGEEAAVTAGVAVPMTHVVDVPVAADLHVESVAWGTRITMTCRYEGAPPSRATGPPMTYQLVVVSAVDQSAENVASWQALPGKDATVAGSTELSVDQIAEFELRAGDGRVLLEGSPAR
jgi:putative zinc finger protein